MLQTNISKASKASMAFMLAILMSACGSGSKPGDSSSSSSSGSVVTVPLIEQKDGYVALTNGRGGQAYESVSYPESFDKSISLEFFKETLYPVLRENCAGCHSTENTAGAGAQAPLHSDVDVEVAHEHALTKVNFQDVHRSILSTRLWIDRHNCFADSCAEAADIMDGAIANWRAGISVMLSQAGRGVPVDVEVTDEEVKAWIAEDIDQTPAEDREFIQYATFHTLHNEGVSAEELNLARVGLSKALNSVARWAPELVNPVDVSEKGMVYRFDIRDYWGYTNVDTSGNFELLYGGSDDDLAFGSKVDIHGNPVSFNDLDTLRNRVTNAVTRSDTFARTAWQRVLHGNTEGSSPDAALPPNVDGFVGKRSRAGNGQDYIKAEDFEYVEATQLIYTLTRPDVYNAIMSIPGYMSYLEDELDVDTSDGMDSFEYIVQYEAISIDSRMYYRARRDSGSDDFLWKTFDTFATQFKDIDEVYANEEQNSPFWEAPIPVFISAGGGGGISPSSFTMIALRNLGPGGERGGGFYTGTDQGSFGGQQSFESLIYNLPNGLQGYAIYGGYGQRRTDIYTNTIRDPRLLPEVADDILDNYAGFGYPKGASGDEQVSGISDVRLNLGSSCIGCHTDGIKRGNNDLRDWLDEDPSRLPGGEHGVDVWIDDESYVSRVRELYKPSSETRKIMEADRVPFLKSMHKIQQGMIFGNDKNVYQEPVIWSIEWAKKYYGFPLTRST